MGIPISEENRIISVGWKPLVVLAIDQRDQHCSAGHIRGSDGRADETRVFCQQNARRREKRPNNLPVKASWASRGLSKKMPTAMFHEKQFLMHCAVHTLNNLFQESWATASLMEDIAKELFNREATLRTESGMGRMWINPYKSLVPQVGYYDINCLIEALKLRHCHVSLHAVFNPKDPNAVAKSLEHLAPATGGVRGIVVNRVSKSLLGGLYTTHHFYAIIPSKGAAGKGMAWYIVDSKGDAPEIIGGASELALYLGMEAREHQGHVFVVSEGDCQAVAGDGSG